jgi:hypothetical protein
MMQFTKRCKFAKLWKTQDRDVEKMPPVNETIENKTLIRVLCYGPPKTKKTWWALTAAAAGFNVVVLDSDKGMDIARQIPVEFRKKIFHIDITDEMRTDTAARFTTLFCRGMPFIWDEQAKKQVFSPSQIVPEHSYYFVDSSLLDNSTVVVKDSWTQTSLSIIKAFNTENQIDPADAEKPEWEGYRWVGALGDWILGQLQALPCHFVLVGHRVVYEKYEGEGKSRKLKWTRDQIKSTSGPHAMTIGLKFSDILRFYQQGAMFFIDATSDAGGDSGARLLPPQRFNWQDLSFKRYCEVAGIKLPDANAEPKGLRWFAPGEPVDFSLINMTNLALQNKPIVAPSGASSTTAQFQNLLGQKKG